MKTTCDQCKWGVFPMTKHNPPRAKSGATGYCEWPIPILAVANCFRQVRDAIKHRRGYITKSIGITCPVWEAKGKGGRDEQANKN